MDAPWIPLQHTHTHNMTAILDATLTHSLTPSLHSHPPMMTMPPSSLASRSISIAPTISEAKDSSDTVNRTLYSLSLSLSLSHSPTHSLTHPLTHLSKHHSKLAKTIQEEIRNQKSKAAKKKHHSDHAGKKIRTCSSQLATDRHRTQSPAAARHGGVRRGAADLSRWSDRV